MWEGSIGGKMKPYESVEIGMPATHNVHVGMLRG